MGGGEQDRIAHPYLPEQIKDIYEEIVNRAKLIYECMRRIEKYIKEKVEGKNGEIG